MQSQMLRINQFTGLNENSPADAIGDSELVTAQDVLVNSPHELKKREPFYNVSSSNPWPYFCLWFGVYITTGDVWCLSVNGTNNKLIAHKNPSAGTLYSSSTTTFGNVTAGVQYNDTYYLLSATGIYTVTAAALTATYGAAVTGGTPGCTTGCIFKERLFVADYTLKSRVKYSDAGAPTTFGGASFVDVGVGDGQNITGIVPLYNDKLLIFKERSIYVLYVQGTDVGSWQLKLINTYYGAISYNTIRFFEGVVYFVSAIGPCRTDGLQVDYLGQQLDTFRQQGYTADSHAGIMNRSYLVAINFLTYLYNIDTGAWTIMSNNPGFYIYYTTVNAIGSAGVRLGLLVVSSNQTGANTVFLGNYTPDLYNYNSSSAPDTPSFSISTKLYDLGAPEVFKRWKYATVTVTGAGSFSFTTTDGAGTVSSTQTIVISSGSQTKSSVLRFKIARFSKALQFNVTHSGDYPCSLLSIDVAYSVKDLTAKASSNA